MNVQLASHSDVQGGAARATLRLHEALSAAEIDSSLLVAFKESDNKSIEGPQGSLGRVHRIIRSLTAKQVMRLQLSANMVWHSPAVLPSGLIKGINVSTADLINLHWIGNEFLSVRDIARIRKPIVWTLHDMWAFCGAEHYAEEEETSRWRVGYRKNNRPVGHRKLDIDRWTWKRKQRAWQRPIHIVTPSHWLAGCVGASALMHTWPVTVVPNPLDTETFQPHSKLFARQALRLPDSVPIVMFGALGGSSDQRKGWDILQKTLITLARTHPEIHCVVFGQSEPVEPPRLGVPIHWLGMLKDEVSLVLAYNAADVIVVPSRQENLGQTGTEAQSCGCPVVAFDCTGMPDVVEHGVSGYLAKPFESEDLAEGVRWVLQDEQRHRGLAIAARERAERLWSRKVIVPQYVDAYQAAIDASNSMLARK